jgi:hypothetical protein
VAQEQWTRPEETVGGRKKAVWAGGGGDVLEVVRAVGLGRLAGVVGGGAGRVPVRPSMRAWFLGWLEQQLLVF